MERYEAYKDGGWLGDVPSSWNLVRISSLYDSRNEKVSDKDYPPLSVTMQGILPQLETAAKTQDGDNRKLVKKGDFAINSRSDRRGSCGISQYDGSVSLITNVLRPKDASGMDMRFFGHLFKSEKFSDEYFKQGTGIVDDLWSTNWSRMKNILVCCPDLESQQAIADFLDEKTAEIDGIVSETERSIELLREYRKSVISEAVTKGLDPNAPMKDSGIEWIGEILDAWGLPKLGTLTAKIGSGKTPHGGADVYQDQGVPFLRSQNVYDSGLVFDETVYISAVTDAEMSSTRVYQGDVLLNITGGSIGRCCVYNHEEHANVNQHVCIIRSNGTVLPKWIQAFWNSDSGQTVVDAYQTGANREGLNFEQIASARIPFPALHEQSLIIDYLDVKTAEIDALIADKERQVELLKEYRKSLISEAVTGKFKVPGVS